MTTQNLQEATKKATQEVADIEAVMRYIHSQQEELSTRRATLIKHIDAMKTSVITTTQDNNMFHTVIWNMLKDGHEIKSLVKDKFGWLGNTMESNILVFEGYYGKHGRYARYGGKTFNTSFSSEDDVDFGLFKHVDRGYFIDVIDTTRKNTLEDYLRWSDDCSTSASEPDYLAYT